VGIKNNPSSSANLGGSMRISSIRTMIICKCWSYGLPQSAGKTQKIPQSKKANRAELEVGKSSAWFGGRKLRRSLSTSKRSWKPRRPAEQHPAKKSFRASSPRGTTCPMPRGGAEKAAWNTRSAWAIGGTSEPADVAMGPKTGLQWAVGLPQKCASVAARPHDISRRSS